ncbi:MAG: caspase family protein [Deltaproteobacteria bacterium]|nr:caspase family protein [Deltaproteobacteria bacterium]
MIGIPDPKYDVRQVLGRVRAALVGLGFGPQDIVQLPDADVGDESPPTRRAIQNTLTRFTELCEPDDSCLFYYLGHGGRVRLDGLPAEYAEHVFSYLVCAEAESNGEFDGLLDLTLSAAIARLALRCRGNVTTIVDACHSAALIRDAYSYVPGRRRPPPNGCSPSSPSSSIPIRYPNS